MARTVRRAGESRVSARTDRAVSAPKTAPSTRARAKPVRIRRRDRPTCCQKGRVQISCPSRRSTAAGEGISTSFPTVSQHSSHISSHTAPAAIFLEKSFPICILRTKYCDL